VSPDNTARIANLLLGSRGRAYCDDCIASALSLPDRGKARRAATALSESASFRREFGTCSECGRERIVTGL
jgi:hypothetical protein